MSKLGGLLDYCLLLLDCEELRLLRCSFSKFKHLCRYCARLNRNDFWGGEVEILVLSKMLHVPIYVYRTAEETGL